MSLHLGPAAALRDGGPGLRATLPPAGEAARAGEAVPTPVFVVRFAGRLRAWINRCPHRGTELDWEPGLFFDDSGDFLMCATHGALFEPASGRCVSGPCHGRRLAAVAVREVDGEVVLDVD